MSTINIMEIFGNNIKKILASRGMTIQELANDAGIQRADLSRIIHGKQNFTASTMQKISIAVDVPVHELTNPEFSDLITSQY